MGDCARAGEPFQYVISRLLPTQPFISPGYINRVTAYLAGVKAAFTQTRVRVRVRVSVYGP